MRRRNAIEDRFRKAEEKAATMVREAEHPILSCLPLLNLEPGYEKLKLRSG